MAHRLRAHGLRAHGLLSASVACVALFLLICLAGLLPMTAAVHAATLPAAFADTPDIAITKTVGLDGAICATETSLVAPISNTVYFCLTVVNTGNLTSTSQVLDDGLNKVTVTEALAPGGQLVLTNANHPTASQALAFTKTITADFTSPITLTATFSGGLQLVKVATAKVELARASASLKKTVGQTADVCATTTTEAVLSAGKVYYCLTIQNTGNITLVQHLITDPSLGVINRSLDNYPLKPSAVLTLTNAQIGELASDFNGTTNITNTAFYTGTGQYNLLAPSVQAQAKVELAKATIALTTTVSANTAGCGPYDTIGVSPGATIYYCVTIKNTGNLTLTNFVVKDSLLGLDQNFSYILKPGDQLVMSPATPNGLPADLIAKLTVTNAQAAVDTFTVTATTAEGLNNTQSDTTQVSIGTPVIGLAKYLEKDPTSCAPTASLTVAVGEQVYYCLRVENRGQLTLTIHQISEAATGITIGDFTYTLEPNGVLTLTQTLLATLLPSASATQRLGPFTFSSNAVNVVTFTSKTTDGVSTSANASAAINIPQLTAVPTLSPTPSITPIPSPTSTFTPIPSPTWTPSPIPTASPTGTPAPVVASLLPTPTFTPNFLLTGVTTPVSGAQQGQSPLPLPNNQNGQQPISPLPAPTIDNGVVAAAQTATAVAATATGLALLTPPTPFLVETPTLSPTLTATLVPSTTLPAAVVRPLEYPSPTPVPDLLILFAKVVDASIAAAGWIWFLCGSLIFFVTAGVLAGLGVRRQYRPRYALVGNAGDSEDDPYQTIDTPPPAPAPVPPSRPASTSSDDDYWPASLP